MVRRILLAAVFLWQLFGTSSIQAAKSAALGGPQNGVRLATPKELNAPNTFSFDFVSLAQIVGLWADGKGDMILDHVVRNTSSSTTDVFNNLTWYFTWYPGNYSNISAKDESGPLQVDKSLNGDQIVVTVHFRKAVPIGQTYHFKLFITIAGMGSGSGDNWAVNWYTTAGMIENGFVETVAIPASANVQSQSITPPVTERHKNILTWKLPTPDGWTLSVYAPYTLVNGVLGTKLMLQTDPTWASQLYAYNTVSTENIAKWGCFTSSGAMLINYFAASQGITFEADPGTLDTWMKTHSGYTADDGVKHAWFGKAARLPSVGISMYWNSSPGYNADTVRYYIRSGYPVILGVKPEWDPVAKVSYPGHWVLATAIVNEGGVDTFTILDPYYGVTTLNHQWGNSAMVMVLYSASEADQQLLYFNAESPVELLVTDSLGRRAGFDPLSNQTFSEIPGAYYIYEGLSPDSGTGSAIEMKTLAIPDPLSDEYTATIYGTGTGSYKLEVSSMDWQGVSFTNAFEGNVTPGTVETHTVTYNPVTFYLNLPLVVR